MTVFNNPSREYISYTYAGGVIHIRLLVPSGTEGCDVGDIIKIKYDKLVGEYPLKKEWLCEVYRVGAGSPPAGFIFIYARALREKE